MASALLGGEERAFQSEMEQELGVYRDYGPVRSQLMQEIMMLGGWTLWHEYWNGLRNYLLGRMSKRDFDALMLSAPLVSVTPLHNLLMQTVLCNIANGALHLDSLPLLAHGMLDAAETSALPENLRHHAAHFVPPPADPADTTIHSAGPFRSVASTCPAQPRFDLSYRFDLHPEVHAQRVQAALEAAQAAALAASSNSSSSSSSSGGGGNGMAGARPTQPGGRPPLPSALSALDKKKPKPVDARAGALAPAHQTHQQQSLQQMASPGPRPGAVVLERKKTKAPPEHPPATYGAPYKPKKQRVLEPPPPPAPAPAPAPIIAAPIPAAAALVPPAPTRAPAPAVVLPSGQQPVLSDLGPAPSAGKKRLSGDDCGGAVVQQDRSSKRVSLGSSSIDSGGNGSVGSIFTGSAPTPTVRQAAAAATAAAVAAAAVAAAADARARAKEAKEARDANKGVSEARATKEPPKPRQALAAALPSVTASDGRRTTRFSAPNPVSAPSPAAPAQSASKQSQEGVKASAAAGRGRGRAASIEVEKKDERPARGKGDGSPEPRRSSRGGK